MSANLSRILRAAIAVLWITLIAAAVTHADELHVAEQGSTVFVLGGEPTLHARLQKMLPDGALELAPDFESSHLDELAEGWYVLAAAELRPEAKPPFQPKGICRCRVREIGKAVVVVEVPAAAQARLAERDDVVLFRPLGVTTAEMSTLPEWAPLTRDIGSAAANHDAATARSVAEYRLERLGRALHAYVAKHHVLPPALVAGPDGKPWHSWRVLLLPFLGEQELYDRYHFDQPWDGPDNKSLLAAMPDAYRDPVHGVANGSFTHFAACVGAQAAFSEKSIPAEKDGRPNHDVAGNRAVRHFQDNAGFSIFLGSVAEGRIPWTKPDDVLLTEDLPPPGGKNGFAAPHRAIVAGQSVAGGLFLFGDSDPATVAAITTRADLALFRAALNVQDGRTPSRPDEKLPELPYDQNSWGRDTLTITREGSGYRAVLRVTAR